MTTIVSDISSGPFTTGDDVFNVTDFSQFWTGSALEFGAGPVTVLAAPGDLSLLGGNDTLSTRTTATLGGANTDLTASPWARAWTWARATARTRSIPSSC